MTTLDPEAFNGLRRGADEFNRGRFFECHDTLEEIWHGVRGEARDFLQGLIHVAVGFYHLGNGNLAGGQNQLEKGLKRLSGYGDTFVGMDLATLRKDVERWIEKIRKGEDLRASVADLPKYRFLL